MIPGLGREPKVSPIGPGLSRHRRLAEALRGPLPKHLRVDGIKPGKRLDYVFQMRCLQHYLGGPAEPGAPTPREVERAALVLGWSGQHLSMPPRRFAGPSDAEQQAVAVWADGDGWMADLRDRDLQLLFLAMHGPPPTHSNRTDWRRLRDAFVESIGTTGIYARPVGVVEWHLRCGIGMGFARDPLTGVLSARWHPPSGRGSASMVYLSEIPETGEILCANKATKLPGLRWEHLMDGPLVSDHNGV